MDEKKKILEQHMRVVCKSCHKKVHEHSVDDLMDCITQLDFHKHYLQSWLDAKFDVTKYQDTLDIMEKQDERYKR